MPYRFNGPLLRRGLSCVQSTPNSRHPSQAVLSLRTLHYGRLSNETPARGEVDFNGRVPEVLTLTLRSRHKSQAFFVRSIAREDSSGDTGVCGTDMANSAAAGKGKWVCKE